MRGVLRYRRDDVVAILDSTRAPGDTEDGVPVVRDRRRGAPLRARTTALVGVATQGGRFPPAWIDLLKQCVAARARRRERPARLPRTTTPSCASSPRAHGVGAARPAPPAGRPLDRDGREPRRAGHDRAHRRLRLRDREDDGLARARPRGAAARRRARSSSRPGRPGIAIAGWGIAVDAVVADFIAGAAERLVVEGARARRRAALGRGPGLDHPSGLLRRDARALPRQRRRTCSCSATRRGRPRSREPAAGRIRSRRSRELVELHERLALPARPARVVAVALNTRATRTRTTPGRRSRRGRGRDGPARRRSGPLRRGEARRRRPRASEARRDRSLERGRGFAWSRSNDGRPAAADHRCDRSIDGEGSE